MLKIENIEVTGWEAAIRGMRNPMNSWDKSDSGYGCGDQLDTPDIQFCSYCAGAPFCNGVDTHYVIGKNDLDLMKRLTNGGSVHAKYRRMINVTMDIIAPLYYFKELDTYKVGTVCNSCSTMHKIQEKEFTLDDFSCEHIGDLDINPLKETQKEPCKHDFGDALRWTIHELNLARKLYLETKDKRYWWQMIQLLPSSYNQRRTIQLNYEVLSHIYFDRKDHKLDCWHTFCDMIRQLPYAEDIIIVGSKSSENDSMDILKKENEELKKKVEFLESFVNSYTPGLNGF